MLYEEWKSRYKNLKNFNTVLQRCPRFWPLAPPRGMNPGVYSLGISEDPPRYLSSKFDASVRSDCWDISIWKTLTQCDGNGNANANVDDRGDYNSSPCTSYRRAKNWLSKQSGKSWKKKTSENYKQTICTSTYHGQLIDWLCWGLTTRQPLRVILCRLPEKGRKEIEERVEEMNERDREERGTGMKVKKQKK